jgi:hypothetical protein
MSETAVDNTLRPQIGSDAPNSHLQRCYHDAENNEDRKYIRRLWAPPIDLEDVSVNPEVITCLHSRLAAFIAAWKRRDHSGQRVIVKSAVSALYRCFTFNAAMEWEPNVYHERMMVRALVVDLFPFNHSVTECGLLLVPSPSSCSQPEEEVAQASGTLPRLLDCWWQAVRAALRHPTRPRIHLRGTSPPSLRLHWTASQ